MRKISLNASYFNKESILRQVDSRSILVLLTSVMILFSLYFFHFSLLDFSVVECFYFLFLLHKLSNPPFHNIIAFIHRDHNTS